MEKLEEWIIRFVKEVEEVEESFIDAGKIV